MSTPDKGGVDVFNSRKWVIFKNHPSLPAALISPFQIYITTNYQLISMVAFKKKGEGQ